MFYFITKGYWYTKLFVSNALKTYIGLLFNKLSFKLLNNKYIIKYHIIFLQIIKLCVVRRNFNLLIYLNMFI